MNKNPIKPVHEMLIKNIIVLWNLQSDQATAWESSFFSLTRKTSEHSIMHCNFPWPTVLKIIGIVSIADSFGNQATNCPMVLLRGSIHVLISFEQWVGKCKTDLRDLSKVQNEVSLVSFFAPVNFSFFCFWYLLFFLFHVSIPYP